MTGVKVAAATMKKAPPSSTDTNAASASSSTEATIASHQQAPPGRNVSGRSWKHLQSQPKRASSLRKTKFNNQKKTWDQLQAAKRARKEALELQNELKEQKKQEALAKKERRLENEKRRAENEYKNMQQSVQTLNPNKLGTTLKALSKKQLRQVKKTRLNTKTGVVEYVPAYAK